MGVQSAATTKASRNRIGVCTRGPASWADLAVRVYPGRNLFIPPLVPRAVYWYERGGFLVLRGIPRPVLGESCRTSIKYFAIFPPRQKNKIKIFRVFNQGVHLKIVEVMNFFITECTWEFFLSNQLNFQSHYLEKTRDPIHSESLLLI